MQGVKYWFITLCRSRKHNRKCLCQYPSRQMSCLVGYICVKGVLRCRQIEKWCEAECKSQILRVQTNVLTNSNYYLTNIHVFFFKIPYYRLNLVNPNSREGENLKGWSVKPTYYRNKKNFVLYVVKGLFVNFVFKKFHSGSACTCDHAHLLLFFF